MISDRVQNLSQLRRLLAERFPQQRRDGSPSRPRSRTACWPTGVEALDKLLNGGLPHGAITELVAASPASGSSLVLLRTIERAVESGHWLALVDAQDSFDPSPLTDTISTGLLWVRCCSTADAMRAVDLLLRDDNVPLVILDLRLSPTKQLRRIPSSAWYRLQRLIKRRTCACLVVTPSPMIGSAQFRVALQSQFQLDDLMRSADELVPELQVELLRAHGVGEEEPELVAEAG